MKNENEIAETPEPTLIINFTDKTTGDVYEYIVDRIQKAVHLVAEMGTLELKRALRLRLEEFVSMLANAEARSKFSGRVLDRATFEELRGGKL